MGLLIDAALAVGVMLAVMIWVVLYIEARASRITDCHVWQTPFIVVSLVLLLSCGGFLVGRHYPTPDSPQSLPAEEQPAR